MAGSWGSPELFGSPAGDHELDLPPLLRYGVRLWRDVPSLSRHLTHLLLALLLYLVVWNRLPRDLPIPRVAPLAIEQPAASEGAKPIVVTESSGAPRYLQRAAVPSTSHANRDALPLTEPRRSVRTAVSLYQVQSGDTILDIASMFGLQGSSLLWANDRLADNPDFLRIGEEIVVLPVDGAYHTVASGETLEIIAAEYQVETEVVRGYVGNHLGAEDVLKVGQKLIIPGGVKAYVPRRVFAYGGEVPNDAKQGTGSFVWPMSGYVTQRYWDGHRAIDVGASTGTSVVASDSGYVAVAQWSDVGYGRMIIIEHGNGFQTLYAHLQAYYVEAGQSIAKGETLGKCGSTGNATGPHLHFEVIKNGERSNPFIYLP